MVIVVAVAVVGNDDRTMVDSGLSRLVVACMYQDFEAWEARR